LVEFRLLISYPSAKPGNEGKRRIYGRWVKFTFYFKLFVVQVRVVWEDVGDFL